MANFICKLFKKRKYMKALSENTFLLSDTHFGNEYIFLATRRCRDFPSVKACDEAIINN